MKLVILFIGLGTFMTTAFTAYAKSYESFCFQGHIKESISINKERRKLYSQMTDGRSDKIFNTLIGYELLTLAPALYFDLKAIPYQKNGMDLFCHEFMSMQRAPKFDAEARIIPEEQFRPFDWKFYKERMSAALKRKDVAEIRKTAIEALLELKTQPHYHCFSRHFVESIYRFAYFLPLRTQQASELSLADPANIIFNVIKLHLFGMKDSHKIDLWSQPIQMSGIPILCSEIPDLLFDLNAPELDVLKQE